MKKILILSGLILSFAFATTVFAVGSNGSFENGANIDPIGFNTLTAPDNTSITDWTVNSGSIDYIGSYWSASVGTRSIDLNGFVPGSISQILPTVIGATYNITFDLSGNPDSRVEQTDPYWSPSNKEVSVSINGLLPQIFSYDTFLKGNGPTDMKWENHTYSFIATTTSTTLTFTSVIPGAFGPTIDNVLITETLPAPVATCPINTTKKLLETVIVPANLSTATLSYNSLSNGASYLLVSSGSWTNSNNVADAEYISKDSWSTVYNGYDFPPYMLGEGSFDLQVGGSFVNWGSYNANHSYSYLYTGSGSQANFLIFDGDATPSTPVLHPEWYGDNSGSIQVDIYSCARPVLKPQTKDECKKGGWKLFTDPKFKNQGDCVSYVVSHGHSDDKKDDENHQDNNQNNHQNHNQNNHQNNDNHD